MSPERIEMIVEELDEVRKQMADTIKFQGKVEGSVRVLHFFITLATGALIAFTVIGYQSMLTLDSLKSKMADFNPVKVELMYSDIADLKAKVNNLEQYLPSKKVR